MIPNTPLCALCLALPLSVPYSLSFAVTGSIGESSVSGWVSWLTSYLDIYLLLLDSNKGSGLTLKSNENRKAILSRTFPVKHSLFFITPHPKFEYHRYHQMESLYLQSLKFLHPYPVAIPFPLLECTHLSKSKQP